MQEKIKEFLNNMSINSEQTKKVYSFALSHFQTFLGNSEYKDYDLETILVPLIQKEIDVYMLLGKFVGYLTLRQDATNANTKLSIKSILLYVAGVKSYLQFYDIDIIPYKLKNRVKLPKKLKKKSEPIKAQDITTILLSCTNARLKVFLLVLASSGMRSIEALVLRNCDVDFSSSPTKIHIRPEYSKTKQENYIYISDEATKELRKFIDSKAEFKKPDDLIFSKQNYYKDSMGPIHIYRRLHQHFIKLLEKVEMDKRKDGQGIQRRTISFHSFRRFVYTKVSNTVGASFAEWLLGHSASVYWDSEEGERRELYIKCMKYLTFLDYPTIESIGQDFESKLQERDKEFEDLRKVEREKSILLEEMKSRLESLEEERNYFEESTNLREDHIEVQEKGLIQYSRRGRELEERVIKYEKLISELDKKIEGLRQKSSKKEQGTKKRNIK